MENIKEIINDIRLDFGFDEKNYIFYNELITKKGKRYDYINKNNIDITLYSSHSPSCETLFEVLNQMNISETDSILDIGSGKGFALVIFSLFNFKNITGVEINKKDYDICLNNLNILKLEKKINLINDDIFKFDEINQYNYFYFYNPFDCQVFDKIISKIISFCKDNIKIIYKNIHSEEEVILKKYNFVIIKKISGKDRDYYVYEKL